MIEISPKKIKQTNAPLHSCDSRARDALFTQQKNAGRRKLKQLSSVEDFKADLAESAINFVLHHA